ncbi:hypothetical protein BKA70DRAFT_1443268 [Coprinopsis sp. MPI-PUGE-AT-0042]|nr:hypothetical protein BKA70DRAFT_1443268 [Coprinopsis sp. MPI-PUGE-AT-0042]
MCNKPSPKSVFRTEEEHRARRCQISNASYHRNREQISARQAKQYRELHPKPVDIVKRAQAAAEEQDGNELVDPNYWLRQGKALDKHVVAIVGTTPKAYFQRLSNSILEALRKGKDTTENIMATVKPHETRLAHLQNIINLVHEKILNLSGVGPELGEVDRIRLKIDYIRRSLSELIAYAEMDDGHELLQDEIENSRASFQLQWD